MSFYNDPAYQAVRSIRTELTEELARNMRMWHSAAAFNDHAACELHHARHIIVRDRLNAVLAVLDMIEERHANAL